MLIPTSGTTGRSKLVTQTHRAYVMAGEGFPWWMELTPDDRLMTSLPLFHINAPTYSMLGSVGARASLALLPGFSASTFIDSARRHGATEFNAIGAMLEILMRQPERPDDAENPLRLCYTGPAPTEQRQLEIEERFGLRIVCGYAMSETPYGTIWARGTRPYGTLGSIRQHPALGVVNEGRVMRDGRPAPLGEVGELELRNPAVMKGYWGMPDETAAGAHGRRLAAHRRPGRRPTPTGIYTFVGRIKEVIRRRGENVAPAEIEEALTEPPGGLRGGGRRRAVGAVRGGDQGVRRPAPATPTWRAVRAHAACAARAVQGAALHGGGRRAAAHPHRPRRQAPAPARALGGRDRLREESMTDWLRTDIGATTADSITIRGRDLAGELMGRVTFTELAFLLVQGRMPDGGRDDRCSTPCSSRSPTTASRRRCSPRG